MIMYDHDNYCLGHLFVTIHIKNMDTVMFKLMISTLIKVRLKNVILHNGLRFNIINSLQHVQYVTHQKIGSF